jgi:hypothetical protein
MISKLLEGKIGMSKENGVSIGQARKRRREKTRPIRTQYKMIDINPSACNHNQYK